MRRALLASVDLPPATFSEKVRYRMAVDRRPILVTFSDRVAVRRYVAERVGDRLLPRLYAVTDEPETLAVVDLPREFALKASHGSGGMIFVGDHAPSDIRLPEPPVGWSRLHVHPDSLDWDRLVALSRHWLSLRYRQVEWAYSRVKPHILVEELLHADWQSPVEFKFWTFDGSVEFVSAKVGHFGQPRRTVYSRQWQRVLVTYFGIPQGPDVDRPAELDEMIGIAEELGRGIDFVRVDLYAIGGRIVFGEMTVYPEGGEGDFQPPAFDWELGARWQMSGRLPLLARIDQIFRR